MALKRARSDSFISKDERRRVSKGPEREPLAGPAGFRFADVLSVMVSFGALLDQLAGRQVVEAVGHFNHSVSHGFVVGPPVLSLIHI